MGVISGISRWSAGLIGLATLCWAATWLVKGYYLGGGLLVLAGYAALPLERSRHLVTFGKLGVGGFLTERIAFWLWAILLFFGITALVSAGGLST